MSFETFHEEGMKELLAHPNPIQRGKGIFMKHGVVSGFRAALIEGKADIKASEMEAAGIQVLASLLLGLAGPNPVNKLLVYRAFLGIYCEMAEVEEKDDADPE